jgi:hypothetical protein
MAAVHLDRPVGGVERPSRRLHRVGGDVGLQPAQQGVRSVCAAGQEFVTAGIGRKAAL